MIQTVSLWCTIALFVCVALNLVRVVKGPSMADRVVALDGIIMDMIGIVVLYSIHIGVPFYFDLVLVFSLLGFVGTVCFAKFIGKGKIIQ